MPTTEDGIPYPVDGDVANVPQDLHNLANKIQELFFDDPQWSDDVDQAIAKKIYVYPIGHAFPTGMDDGAIVFFYQT